jgi:hypothetical protein
MAHIIGKRASVQNINEITRYFSKNSAPRAKKIGVKVK